MMVCEAVVAREGLRKEVRWSHKRSKQGRDLRLSRPKNSQKSGSFDDQLALHNPLLDFESWF